MGREKHILRITGLQKIVVWRARNTLISMFDSRTLDKFRLREMLTKIGSQEGSKSILKLLAPSLVS